MNELILAYWRHAEEYYGFRIDTERSDAACLRSVLAEVRHLCGLTPAGDFDPRAWKASVKR